MKPFYGIDRTNDKKNQAHNGECFIAASVSGIQGRVLGQAAEQLVTVVNRTKLPLPLRIVQTVSGFVALMVGIGIIRALPTVDLDQAYENAPGLFWTAGVCAGLWLILTAIGNAVQKRGRASEECGIAERRMESAVVGVYQELGVPRDAKDVDVICITHRWKNGKMKIHTRGMEMSPYRNEPFKVFVRDGKLCMVNLEHRYEIGLDELKCLRSVKKPIMPTGWNKDEDLNEGFYKPYKLSVDQYRRIHMKRYGILELEHNGESWGVWLPPYELNYISAVTKLDVTQ